MIHLTNKVMSRFPGRPIAAFILAVLLVAGAFVPTAFSEAIEPVNGGPGPAGEVVVSAETCFQGPLKVMTLNLAHGRKTAFSQVFLSWQTIHKNLVDVSRVIATAAADIVALQEADGPSWWSGNFDHVALVAKEAGYPWYTRAGHMDAWSLHYGAALLARKAYLETRAYRFKASLPTPAKGFLLGRFGWYPRGPADSTPVYVDVVSVHLDFSRRNVRARQIAEMRAAFAHRKNPLIIMGDFNSTWLAEDSVVRELARQGGLQAYKPEAADLGTFGDRRLDWILISADLEFISYTVLPDEVSDHLGVVAEVGMKR